MSVEAVSQVPHAMVTRDDPKCDATVSVLRFLCQRVVASAVSGGNEIGKSPAEAIGRRSRVRARSQVASVMAVLAERGEFACATVGLAGLGAADSTVACALACASKLIQRSRMAWCRAERLEWVPT